MAVHVHMHLVTYNAADAIMQAEARLEHTIAGSQGRKGRAT